MKRALFFVVACVAFLSACRQKEAVVPMGRSGNAVYYWQTDFRLDSAKLDFLARHHIGRIYCRYFDVVYRPSMGPLPNADISFHDVANIPDSIDIVPTVFIMEECMRQPHDSLAWLIVNRIMKMNATNDIQNVHELQIDCDFTARSRDAYYRFLAQVRHEAQRQGMALSTTIRLHQLSMPTPPADYGVLMLYNTGDPNRAHERNPILDPHDVAPYLRYLPDYPLPLAAAYPVFAWQRTIQGIHVEHTVEAGVILDVKQAVEQRRPDLKQLIITYDLSQTSINRYTPDDYEKIYHH